MLSRPWILRPFPPPVVPSDHSEVLATRLTKDWSLARDRAHANSISEHHPAKPSLFRALASAYGGPYAVAAVLKLANDCLSFVQPQLLRQLLKFVASYRTEEPQPVSRSHETDDALHRPDDRFLPSQAIHGVALSCAMFAAALVQTAILHQYFVRI